jgi:hypothetical protein
MRARVKEDEEETGGKFVNEISTNGKYGALRTSNNPLKASRSKKPQYFVNVVRDKMTKNNNLEFSHRVA